MSTATTDTHNPRQPAAPHSLPHLTDGTFDGEIGGPTAALVDFGAEWCPPCRAIAPALDQLAAGEASRLRVYKVDVDASPAILSRYGVTGLPTLILFRGGKPVERLVGYRTKAQIAASLAPHLAAPTPAAGDAA